MSCSNLPPDQCRELLSQLRSARHAVGAARLAGDPAAEAMAHARVHTAKLALGERGDTWWEHAA